MTFLNSLENTTDIITKRIENYNRIRDYLQITKFNINKSLIIKDNNLVIEDCNLQLANIPLSENGYYGIAYSIINEITDNEKYQYAVKIQLNMKECKEEIKILQKLTKLFLKDKNIHLPVIYCNFISTNFDNLQNPLYPSFIQKLQNQKRIKNYNISLVELGNGDFKSFINSPFLTNELFINAVSQIFMCILSLHNYNILHDDSHWGNFLYFKIKSGGYFHYIINDKDYYLENLGYLWISWDFNVCVPLYRNTDYIKDYDLFSLFIRNYDEKYINRNYIIETDDKNILSFRYYGNLAKNIKIPFTIRNVADYIERLQNNKLEIKENKFTKNEALKLRRYDIVKILEKEFIINIMELLDVFINSIAKDDIIISSCKFNNI